MPHRYLYEGKGEDLLEASKVEGGIQSATFLLTNLWKPTEATPDQAAHAVQLVAFGAFTLTFTFTRRARCYV